MQFTHVSTEDGNILVITFTGELKDATDADLFKSDLEIVAKAVKDMHTATNGMIRVLIDVSGFAANYVREGVDALVDLAEQDENFVEKTAVFGGSFKVRAIGETIIVTSGRKNIKFFETKAEAMSWLDS